MGKTFDFTAAIRTLVEDIASRCPDFRHLQVPRILIGVTQARYASAHGLQARVTPLRMEHRFLAGREEQRVTHHVVLRFRDDIETGARFRDRDRIFRVLAVEDADERRTYLRALCEEITS